MQCASSACGGMQLVIRLHFCRIVLLYKVGGRVVRVVKIDVSTAGRRNTGRSMLPTSPTAGAC